MSLTTFFYDLLSGMYGKSPEEKLDYIYQRLERPPVEGLGETRAFVRFARRGAQLLLEQPGLSAKKRKAYAKRIEEQVKDSMPYIIHLEGRLAQRRLGGLPSDPKSKEAGVYFRRFERVTGSDKMIYDHLMSATGQDFLRLLVTVDILKLNRWDDYSYW